MFFCYNQYGDNMTKDSVKVNSSVFTITFLMLLLIVLVSGSSYALIQKNLIGKHSYSMQTGNFLVEFKDNNTLNLTNTLPMYDNVGITKDDEFVFSVTNNGDYKANYSVYIKETSDKEMASVLRYAVNYGDGYSMENVSLLSNNKYIVQNKSLNIHDVDTYRLKFWVDIDASEEWTSNKFSGKIVLDASVSDYKYATNVLESLYNNSDESIEAISKYGDKEIKNGISDYRFSGSSLNNYVWFNCSDGYTSGENHCERWQIVGSILNNTENTSGNYAMLKLVRTDALKTNYMFDDANNNFENASINKYLNNEYYQGLEASAKALIINAKWYTSSNFNSMKVKDIYISEKDKHIYNNVGLLAISDYAYASSSDNWSSLIGSYRFTNNWLNKANYWLINGYYVNDNIVSKGDKISLKNIHPAVYLRPDVSIINGLGTIDNPYELNIVYPMDLGIKTSIKQSNI